jgi:hypothetical protein
MVVRVRALYSCLAPMSLKTIAKFLLFVIPALAVGACSSTRSNPSADRDTSPYGPPALVGTIASRDVSEASGIAASRCQQNVLWTHNDSGDDAYIFAIAPSGKSLGTWKVTNAQNIDWEDIAAYKDAAGKCYLYIGETGDNKRKRDVHTIYRVAEPVVTADNATSDRKHPRLSDPVQAVNFRYPDYAQDAETLMVHPKTAEIYVVTKRISGPAGVYKINNDFADAEPRPALKIAEIAVPAIPNGFVTGGDISPDGRHMVICDYSAAYEWTLPDGEANFDEIWKTAPVAVDIGKRKNGEAVSYSVDGRSIFATSEGRDAPIFEIGNKK